MTDVYDIPYKDIQKFLVANNKDFKNEDDAYNKALILLKDKKAIGHTTSIIEWMMAHNLLIRKVNIPIYAISEIDKMSQDKINKLAKLLTMSGNDRNNIKNILRYLRKLDDETLLPDINDIILNNLTKLELQNINVADLNYDSVINLLKTHRNKKEIRNFISDNLEKIIIYNSLEIDYSDGNDIGDLLSIVNIYNKNIIIEIIMDNKEQLKKYYSDKELNDIIKEAKENDEDQEGEVYIGKNEMDNLVNFTLNLIDIKEIGLAKKVFNITNEQYYFGRDYPYNNYLVDLSRIKSINVLKIIIDFMGEREYIKNYESIFDTTFDKNGVNFFNNLVTLKQYELLGNILELFIYSNSNPYNSKLKEIKTLKQIIKSENDNLILKYIDDINNCKNIHFTKYKKY